MMGRQFVSTRIALMMLLALSVFALNAPAAGGKFALHLAVQNQDFGRVQTLLETGTPVNEKDEAGFTPLFYAAQRNYHEIANLLVNKGADVNAKDQYGSTPLHYAAGAGHLDACRVLVNAGADLTVQNLMGGTPVGMARASGKQDVVAFLSGGSAEPAPGSAQQIMMLRDGPLPLEEQEPSPIADPNVVRAKVRQFQGLETELELLDRRSRFEIRYWMEEEQRTRSDLAKAVHRTVRSEFAFLREIAEKEKAAKATKVLDEVLKNRAARYIRLIRTLDEQQEQTAGPEMSGGRGRYRTRTTRSRGRYRSNGYADDNVAAEPMSTPAPHDQAIDPNIFKIPLKLPVKGLEKESLRLTLRAEDEAWKWLRENTASRKDLAGIVNNQIAAELILIRKAAEQEKTEKTIAAIDGLLLTRKIRLDKLIEEMEKDALAPASVQPVETQDSRRRGRYDNMNDRRGTRRRR